MSFFYTGFFTPRANLAIFIGAWILGDELASVLVGRCPVWQYDWDTDRNETEQWYKAQEIAGELLALDRDDWDF